MCSPFKKIKLLIIFLLFGTLQTAAGGPVHESTGLLLKPIKNNALQKEAWQRREGVYANSRSPLIHRQTPETARLRFTDPTPQYRDILQADRIPDGELKDLLTTLSNCDFYPSPEGLSVLLALGEQESSLLWNPILNSRKKELLKTQFQSVVSRFSGGFLSTISHWFLSDEIRSLESKVMNEFYTITDLDNPSTTEYDVYLWSLNVQGLLHTFINQNRYLASLGQRVYDLHHLIEKTKQEPQTFGIWQVNVNHLQRRLVKNPAYELDFPELFTTDRGEKRIDRQRLIQALSGIPDAVLSRPRTLALIIKSYLKPRYEAHIRGEPDDLMYFIVEHLTGELTTYTAAVQAELNRQLGSELVLDGDLVFYKRYSNQVDWRRTSRSQQQLFSFIRKNESLFQQPVHPDQLVKSICSARTWSELSRSELYRQIMKDKVGTRIFPTIKSRLYQQQPKVYAKKIMDRARRFF